MYLLSVFKLIKNFTKLLAERISVHVGKLCALRHLLASSQKAQASAAQGWPRERVGGGGVGARWLHDHRPPGGGGRVLSSGTCVPWETQALGLRDDILEGVPER